jgi:hypothetical protein
VHVLSFLLFISTATSSVAAWPSSSSRASIFAVTDAGMRGLRDAGMFRVFSRERAGLHRRVQRDER